MLFSFLKPDRLGGSRAALDEEEDGDTVSFLLSSCPTTAGRFCARLGLSLPGVLTVLNAFYRRTIDLILGVSLVGPKFGDVGSGCGGIWG